MTPPLVQVGASFKGWEKISATPWLRRQLRFGLPLPWTKPPAFQRISMYNLEPNHQTFVVKELMRWEGLGYIRKATQKEQKVLLQKWFVSPAFVTGTAKNLRLVVD